MKDNYEYSDIHTSIRKRTFKFLEKNHDLKPSDLCTLLGISYQIYGPTITQYRRQWKCEYKNRLGLKCLKFHAARGWIYALKLIERTAALGRSDVTGGVWRLSRSRNRMFVWKDAYGRLEWFETGRINLWIRKPATPGKVKQLLAGAFYATGLVSDIQVFHLWANSARFKGAHAELDLGQHLPYARVDFLKDSLGVVVKMGDASHPTSLEIEFVYPDWAERNERLLDQNRRALENFSDFLKDLGQPKDLRKDVDRNMVF